MSRSIVLLPLSVAALALTLTPMASAQSTLPPRTEIEPNNSIAQPDPVPVLSDTAIRGSIVPADDRDFFRVVVSQQASVRFQTWVPDHPACFPGQQADTFIRLFDTTGQQIAADDDSGVQNCSLLVVTLTPGTYFISVEEAGVFNEPILAYTLEIDFTPDQVPPGCPANDDDDGDGLTNDNESVFSTLLRNSDSDDDGIRDGNDDGNGNGDDDEDEDDDDDCPDEDSDDDGEDDEDEDDEEDDDDDD